jgi:GDP-L-galactose phosphorylase
MRDLFPDDCVTKDATACCPPARSYDVSACPSRVLPGPSGYVAQLNEGRATKKRATEFTADRVLQPFDAGKFHFGKAALGEVLLAFAPGEAAGGASGLLPAQGPLAEALGSAASDLVLINVSPIEQVKGSEEP